MIIKSSQIWITLLYMSIIHHITSLGTLTEQANSNNSSINNVIQPEYDRNSRIVRSLSYVRIIFIYSSNININFLNRKGTMVISLFIYANRVITDHKANFKETTSHTSESHIKSYVSSISIHKSSLRTFKSISYSDLFGSLKRISRSLPIYVDQYTRQTFFQTHLFSNITIPFSTHHIYFYSQLILFHQ